MTSNFLSNILASIFDLTQPNFTKLMLAASFRGLQKFRYYVISHGDDSFQRLHMQIRKIIVLRGKPLQLATNFNSVKFGFVKLNIDARISLTKFDVGLPSISSTTN